MIFMIWYLTIIWCLASDHSLVDRFSGHPNIKLGHMVFMSCLISVIAVKNP